ncbi:hypothetical protein [Alkalicoccobacillus gibsonii]|uniref:hypothetical protein n=1 Tax=Alkalicoccobacillus gibsonii TaxID=79881 RepID=UPI0035119AC2
MRKSEILALGVILESELVEVSVVERDNYRTAIRKFYGVTSKTPEKKRYQLNKQIQEDLTNIKDELVITLNSYIQEGKGNE